MYQKAVLGNGLRVLTAPMFHTHSVSICVFVGVGSRYESDAESGVSHFIEHMVFKGTEKRPTSQEISEAIEGVGGILNGGTDKELTLYWSKVPQSHFALALDVLSDILLESRFDPAEMEKERQVIIEEISMGRDYPPQRVDMIFDELMWPNHPLGRDIAGSKESVAGITRDLVLDYMQRQYHPSRAVVAIAGNIDQRAALSAVDRVLGKWSAETQPPAYIPFTGKPTHRLRVEAKETEQVHLCLGLTGLSLFDPNRFYLDLLNVILGEGTSSRLFVEIRDKLGLTYNIHSSAEHFLDTGSLSIYAGVEPKKLGVAITAILEQLARLKERIPEPEMMKAKDMTKGRLLLRMEDSRNVASWIGGQEVLTGRVLDIEQVEAVIDAITTEQLYRVAQQLITDVQMRLALVGPVESAESFEDLLKL